MLKKINTTDSSNNKNKKKTGIMTEKSMINTSNNQNFNNRNNFEALEEAARNKRNNNNKTSYNNNINNDNTSQVHKNRKNFDPTENLNKKILSSNFNNKNYKFNKITNLYPTDNSKHHTPYLPNDLNPKEIKVDYFKQDTQTSEYDIIPKDEQSLFLAYRNHFENIREKIIEENKIRKLVDEEKIHILMVNFETSSYDIDYLSLIDPTKQFNKYKLNLDDYLDDKNKIQLFNGQIIKIEGNIRENTIYANRISHPFQYINYSLIEQTVKSYYEIAAPYSVYSIYGPFFDNKKVDFTLFTRILINIEKENPHALIIGGPLCPMSNEEILSGDIQFDVEESDNSRSKRSMSFFDLFKVFLEKINEVFKFRIF